MINVNDLNIDINNVISILKDHNNIFFSIQDTNGNNEYDIYCWFNISESRILELAKILKFENEISKECFSINFKIEVEDNIYFFDLNCDKIKNPITNMFVALDKLNCKPFLQTFCINDDYNVLFENIDHINQSIDYNIKHYTEAVIISKQAKTNFNNFINSLDLNLEFA